MNTFSAKTIGLSVIAVLLGLLVALVPLFASGEGEEEAVVIDVTDDTSEVKEITVTSQDLNFVQQEIRVNRGDVIRLTYENGGGTHNWALDEFDAATEVISGGESTTIEFVADTAGTFEFYCDVGNHRALGMVGSFVVVE